MLFFLAVQFRKSGERRERSGRVERGGRERERERERERRLY